MKFVLSKYVHLLSVSDGRSLLCHGVLGSRLMVSSDVVALLKFFRKPKAVSAAVEKFGESARKAAERFAEAGFLVNAEEAEDEEKQLLAKVVEEPPSISTRVSRGRDRGLYETLESKDFATEILAECRVGVIAECFLERAAGVLVGLGLRHGLRIETQFLRGVDDLSTVGSLDLVIVRNVNVSALESVYDGFYALSSRERKERAEIYLADFHRKLERLLEQTKAVLLVHTLPLPNVSPLGPYAEGKTEDGFFRWIDELNAKIRTWARESDRIHLFDEDWFLGNLGRNVTLDTSVAILSHLGPLEMWSFGGGDGEGWEPARRFDVPRELFLENALAGEYVRFIKVLKGVSRRKLVIVDLDNTLWPGVIGEEDFQLQRIFSPVGGYGDYVGIHQALKFLRARGILLGIVSKNNESDVFEKWKYPEPEMKKMLCSLEDFVSYRINWNSKPDNILSMVQELDLTPDAVVFVDDNPIERERVKQALPQVLVLGEDPAIRYQLLTMPELQTLRVTAEGAERTEMVKGQLQRKKFATAYADSASFLANLGLRYKIEESLTEENRERVQELIQRTNQFNVTTKRYSAAELTAFAREPRSSVFALHLADRFTHYGLIGVCLCRENEIDTFLLSCRVLGMRAEDFFLSYVIRSLQKRLKCREVVGQIIPTPKNVVAAKLFEQNRFIPSGEGRWRYDLSSGGLPPTLEEIFRPS